MAADRSKPPRRADPVAAKMAEEIAEELRFEAIASRVRANPAFHTGLSEEEKRLFLTHAHRDAASYARMGLANRAWAASVKHGPKNFSIALPPCYRPTDVLRFLGRDPQGVSERVFADGFEKAFPESRSAGNDTPAVVRVRFDRETACCETDASDGATEALPVVLRLLGLHTDVAGFEEQFKADPLLGPAIRSQPGLHIPLSASPWEGLVWAFAGQQISLKAAITMRRELILRHGAMHPSGLRAHPTASTISRLNASDLLASKFSRCKAEYITGAARAVVEGTLPLTSLSLASARRAARTLRGVRGIGPWTVQYVMLRALGFQDCLPAADAGLAQGLERLPEVDRRLSESEIRKILDPFTPYRSLATCHIWARL